MYLLPPYLHDIYYRLIVLTLFIYVFIYLSIHLFVFLFFLAFRISRRGSQVLCFFSLTSFLYLIPPLCHLSEPLIIYLFVCSFISLIAAVRFFFFHKEEESGLTLSTSLLSFRMGYGVVYSACNLISGDLPSIALTQYARCKLQGREQKMAATRKEEHDVYLSSVAYLILQCG